MSSSDLPSKTDTVIIGAGIVGNSVAYHLSRMGTENIVLIDKGPLPDPGGSTGHASSFLMPVEHSKEMTHLTQRSIEQYKDFGTFNESGGIEVARTEERIEELKRRIQSAKAWGEETEFLEPEEIEELVPYLNMDLVKGGFYTPGAGTCDPLKTGELMRERARDNIGDGLHVSPNTEVTDIHVENNTVQAVETDRGTVNAENVVIAAGLWSPKIGEMAGVDIPLTPAVHQMVNVGPISFFEDYEGEISFPIVRDMDTEMYERQHGGSLDVGSYQHRPILWDVEDIPSNEEAPLSPTQPSLTQDAFEKSMQDALDFVPDLLDDPDAGIQHEIDGLLSQTPDGAPVVGPVQDVNGLWSCAAIWIKESPAFGEMLAQWMTRGWTDIDLHESNINRFYEYGTSKKYVKERGKESFEDIYDIVHPKEPPQNVREVRTSSFYPIQQELDAEFRVAAGWERPQWYGSNSDLVEKYSDELEHLRRPNEWDAKHWSPIILGEHLHMRNNVGMIGDMGFTIFDLRGGDVVEYLQKLAVADVDADVNDTVYTPILAENGGFVADLTMVRLAHDHYRVITGGADGGANLEWFKRHMSENDDITLVNKSDALCTLGVWGPDARKVLEKVAEEDISDEAFPAYTAKDLTIGDVSVNALRISYVGELGWELYAPMSQGRRLWETIEEAGEEYDIRPVGMGVYGTTGRIEKGYRLMGHELELEYNPAEAGLTFHGVKEEDFIGKDAYAEAIEEENTATLCTLSVDDHSPEGGEPRFMLGGEPVMNESGEVLVDSEGRRSYVTSAGTGPSVGKHLLMAYLPQEYANEGESLYVEYMGQQYPVTVEVAGSRPLFDPENERIRS